MHLAGAPGCKCSRCSSSPRAPAHPRLQPGSSYRTLCLSRSSIGCRLSLRRRNRRSFSSTRGCYCGSTRTRRSPSCKRLHCSCRLGLDDCLVSVIAHHFCIVKRAIRPQRVELRILRRRSGSRCCFRTLFCCKHSSICISARHRRSPSRSFGACIRATDGSLQHRCCTRSLCLYLCSSLRLGGLSGLCRFEGFNLGGRGCRVLGGCRGLRTGGYRCRQVSIPPQFCHATACNTAAAHAR